MANPTAFLFDMDHDDIYTWIEFASDAKVQPRLRLYRDPLRAYPLTLKELPTKEAIEAAIDGKVNQVEAHQKRYVNSFSGPAKLAKLYPINREEPFTSTILLCELAKDMPVIFLSFDSHRQFYADQVVLDFLDFMLWKKEPNETRIIPEVYVCIGRMECWYKYLEAGLWLEDNRTWRPGYLEKVVVFGKARQNHCYVPYHTKDIPIELLRQPFMDMPKASQDD